MKDSNFFFTGGERRPLPDDRDLRHPFHDRGDRQLRRLLRHRQEQVDAHGHQLLPLLTRGLRSHHTLAR